MKNLGTAPVRNYAWDKIKSLFFVAKKKTEVVSNRLSYRSVGLLFLLLCFGLFEVFFPTESFGQTSSPQETSLTSPIHVSTESLFTEKVVTKTQKLAFTQTKVVDPSLPEGASKVVQPGLEGEKVYSTTITYHGDEEYSRSSALVSTTKPTAEVVAVGPVSSSVVTPAGTFNYSHKLRMWATSYTPNCAGCSGITSIGLKAGFGVVAVDPTVIPLRSKVYVPGYGVAIAGDTGGSIKGNKIDLGFNSGQGLWSAQYTDVYILE